MEEPVWLFFGILMVLIAIGIIAKVMLVHNEDMKHQKFLASLDKLQVECNFVCETTEGNLLSIETIFPSGLFLYATEDKICGNYTNELKCVRCNCQIEDYKLNLANSTIAKKFSEHKYNCFFEKLKNKVSINCVG